MISIIVPVYKAENSIRRCVDSILSQSFDDFEIVLVNDGSPDNCGVICEEYADRDNRVIVVHQENQGQAAARNTGLDVASGEWILFCDADDYYYGDTLSQFLYSIDLISHNVLHCFNFYNVWPEGIEKGIKYPAADIELDKICNRIDFLSDRLSHESIGYSVWNKIYSKKLIERYNIRFFSRKVLGNQDDWAEDLTFNLQYFMVTRKLDVSEMPVYLLSKHGTRTEQNENELLGRLNHMSKIFLRLKKTTVYQEPEIAEQFWKIVIWHLRRYFYFDVGAKGVTILREECVESPYWNQLLLWICTALEHWSEIENCWDVVNSNDYRFLLEYLRDGNILIYKIKNYWIWKIKPGIQKVIRRR